MAKTTKADGSVLDETPNDPPTEAEIARAEFERDADEIATLRAENEEIRARLAKVETAIFG